MSFVLQTSRLRLREMSLDDLDAVAGMLANPQVMRHFGQCYSREESAEWIHRQQQRYTDYGHGYWLALDRTTEQVVGQVGILMSDFGDGPTPALGYIIHDTCWNQGYAFEAAAACLQHAFTVLAYDCVACLIRPVNIPSLRLAIRLGLRPRKHVEYAGFAHLVLEISKRDSKNFSA